MSTRRDPELESNPLPEEFAKRLLTRASELDAAGSAATALAELRAAATAAGISERAFDAALAEMRAEPAARPTAEASTRTRSRRWAWAVAALGIPLFLIPNWVILRQAVPAPVPGIVKETRTLRCLSAQRAGELVRPLLTTENNTIIASPSSGPGGTLTISGTPDQLREVRALLDRHEGTGTGACPVPSP